MRRFTSDSTYEITLETLEWYRCWGASFRDDLDSVLHGLSVGDDVLVDKLGADVSLGLGGDHIPLT